MCVMILYIEQGCTAKVHGGGLNHLNDIKNLNVV